MAAAIRLPKIGDWVLYKLAGGCLRPALVVNVFAPYGSPVLANLIVFMDGSNDKSNWAIGVYDTPLTAWMPSAVQGDGPGQWQFPPQ
jgi:hypothetical protein